MEPRFYFSKFIVFIFRAKNDSRYLNSCTCTVQPLDMGVHDTLCLLSARSYIQSFQHLFLNPTLLAVSNNFSACSVRYHYPQHGPPWWLSKAILNSMGDSTHPLASNQSLLVPLVIKYCQPLFLFPYIGSLLLLSWLTSGVVLTVLIYHIYIFNYHISGYRFFYV